MQKCVHFHIICPKYIWINALSPYIYIYTCIYTVHSNITAKIKKTKSKGPTSHLWMPMPKQVGLAQEPRCPFLKREKDRALFSAHDFNHGPVGAHRLAWADHDYAVSCGPHINCPPHKKRTTLVFFPHSIVVLSFSSPLRAQNPYQLIRILVEFV